jgi:hypothetical protein
MDSQATHDFIGQDAKAILKGFPSLRKFMNTLTDTAGRANVLLEGGDIEGKGFGIKVARKLYDWWKPPMSFEEWREREQSRFRSDAEAEYALEQAKGDRCIADAEKQLARLKTETEAHRRKLHEIREMKMKLADDIGVWLGDNENYINWDEAREHFARREATDKQIEDEDADWDNSATGINKVDWEDIKWGSFTNQFEEYKRQHPNSKIDDLEHFAESILANSQDYKKTTLKKARFYLNVLAKKKLSHHNNIMPTQGGRLIGLSRPAILPAHIGHPALVSDQYPRIPQAFTQVHLTHPVPLSGHGLYAGGGLLDDIYGGTRHMLGVGLFGDIKHTFTKDIPSALIHKAVPAVVSGATGAVIGTATENPVAGFVAGQTIGKVAGKKAGDALGKETGYGLGAGMKRPHLVKGSKEAKEYMASIRRKKGNKGGAIPAPHSRSPITDPSLL